MNSAEKKNTLQTVALLFLFCSVVEYIEFLFIRTDQTILSDNVLTKLFCLCTIFVVLKWKKIKWSEIGFGNKRILKYIGCGLGLGILTFTISYGVEILVLLAQGSFTRVSFYVTNFGLTGASTTVSLSGTAVLICIVVNIVNVLAEEGLFRGVLLKLGTDAFGFRTGNRIQALLFGCWHTVMVVLSVYDGLMSIPVAIVMAVGYVVLAGILAIEWGVCVHMTGVLWMGIGEHFFNNFIGNILHVESLTGVDELQILRIVLSNILSLVIVLTLNRRRENLNG